MNFVVVSIYWSTLHDDSLKEAGGNIGKIINCYWAHLIPGFSIAFNFAISDFTLRASHVKAIPIISALYGY